MAFRVLIVDDNENFHEILSYGINRSLKKNIKEVSKEKSDILQALGESVPSSEQEELIIDHAYQGEQAVKMVEDSASRGIYDLIFMDVRMPPGIDGIEAVRRINKRFENQLIIICTAYHDQSLEEIRDACKQSKKTLLVYKPFNLDFLNLILDAVIFDDFDRYPELKQYIVC